MKRSLALLLTLMCATAAFGGTVFRAAVHSPEAMTVGPDGNLWVTTEHFGTIHRVNAGNGQLTSFPTGGSSWGDIVSGADGALWFNAGKSIGRITTGGVVTHYAVGESSSSTLGIARGPDGAIWFGSLGGTPNLAIGRLSTDGASARFGQRSSGAAR
jgi:virginiamycin B lyase